MSSPDSAATALAADDLAEITRHGLSRSEIDRQRALLGTPPPPAELVRACTPGDGIHSTTGTEDEAAAAAWAAAAGAGRLLSFVPASGAASRMFQSLTVARGIGDASRAALEAAARAGDADARACLATLDRVRELALAEDLAAVLADRDSDLDACLAAGRCGDLLAALLDADGLDAAARPKGLLPFHRTPAGPRSAFVEHLLEACELVADDSRQVRLHFTITDAHRADFDAELARACRAFEAERRVRFAVEFSTQSPATDTIALAGDGTLCRNSGGRVLFRPGGHGALLGNLEAIRGDLVLIKNIDNIAPERRRTSALASRRRLAGLTALLADEAHALARRLEAPGDAEAPIAARHWLEHWAPGSVAALARASGASATAQRAALLRAIARPLRVCGMVRNTGDPGGGPFWVHDAAGDVRPQIVETAQIAQDSPEQLAILRGSTHFNPTDMVCALRDHHGRPHALANFVDPLAAFVTTKSSAGRTLRALEHPGLWNGAMAGWLSIFVEIPREVFQPVKTLADLLSDAHR